MKKLKLAAFVAALATATAWADSAGDAAHHKAAVETKFKAADKNNDGSLDAAEIAAEAHLAMGKHYGANDGKKTFGAKEAKLAKDLMKADADKNGKVSLDEYVKWATPAPAAKPAHKEKK